MDKNNYKVNTRCNTLFRFVFVLLLLGSFAISGADFVNAQTPTLNPTQAENKRRRDFNETIEEGKSKYVNTGISLQQIKTQSSKQIFEILGRMFGSVGQTAVTPSPGYLPPAGSYPISSALQSQIPQGEPPAGLCTDRVNQALVNLGNHPSNLDIYQQASTKTGVPWEVIASIHYIETGGSFNPNGSCISGRAIGVPEPDRKSAEFPDGKIYSSLLETCVDAGEIFKGKKAMVDFVREKNNLPQPSEYEMIAGQFASYNSPTQGECAMGPSETGYDFIYTGATWPGIPDNGQCQPKGEKFVGDRHIYASACLDSAHENMWFHFHYGGDVREHKNTVGALTLVRAIQKTYRDLQATPNTIPTISYRPPTGNFVYYNQCDPKYESPTFGFCPSGYPSKGMNCSAGCGPTSAAQIIATYANSNYTPLNAMEKAISWGAVDCSGSNVHTIYKLFDEYSSDLEYSSWNISTGDFYQDAINLKPHIDAGWTVLAAATYQPCCGHWAWIVDVDSNNNIWANDVYWFQSDYVGEDATAPMNLTGFINGQYPYKKVTSIDVTGYTLVKKNQ